MPELLLLSRRVPSIPKVLKVLIPALLIFVAVKLVIIAASTSKSPPTVPKLISRFPSINTSPFTYNAVCPADTVRTSNKYAGFAVPTPTEPPTPRTVRTVPPSPTFSSFAKVPIPER